MMKLKSLAIGAVLQSPMSGWTDLPFRLIAREKGLSFAFLEMLLADAVVARSEKTLAMMKTVPADRPIGAQLVGYTPESVAEAARICEASGADLVDLNCGCPVRKIVCKGGGSAILKDPDLARRMFSGMARAVSTIPVTVKMRLGYDDPSGAEAVRTAQIAEDCGISAVTIHGRTRAQGYSGSADYEAIGRIKAAVRIPVIGNGDVIDADAARRMSAVSGCDAIMIGRGGLGNPWIYREITAALEGRPIPPRPGFSEIQQTLLSHIDLQVQHAPFEAAGLLRRIACGYFKSQAGASEFRDAVNRTRSVEEIRRLVESFSPLVSTA